MNNEAMALLGFLGLLVLLVARMWRGQHPQNNRDLHSRGKVFSFHGPKSGNSFISDQPR